MTTYGSRMSFRSRKVDNKKPLNILRSSDAPDIDTVASQRSAVQIETGVEKEEEEEHHLQVAILASQAAYTGGNVASKYIPTPDASKIVENYNALYTADFKQTTSLISFDDIYEDSIGTSYCLDEIDQAALQTVTDPINKKLRDSRFEEIMSLLEEAAADGRINIKEERLTVPLDIQTSLKTLNPKSKSLDSHVDFVFKHWIKRRRDIPTGEPIMPRLRINRSSKSGSDPYLCFKRREMKLQRRTRATDTFFVTKLNKLKEDMKSCHEIIAVTLTREETLEELIKVQDQVIKLQNRIHKKRVAAQYPVSSNPPPTKKQKIIEAAPVVNEPPIIQKVKPKPRPRRVLSTRRKSEEAGFQDITDLPFQFPLVPLSQRFFCYPPSIMPNSTHEDICYRRRRGRGGRITVDRCRFGFSERQAMNYLASVGWVEDNIPVSDEFNAISLRYTSQLLNDQDQSKLQPSLLPGSIHHSDNPPLPHSLLEGKLAAALAAQKSSVVDSLPELDTLEHPPLDIPIYPDFPMPSAES